jgi:hypothetical protein
MEERLDDLSKPSSTPVRFKCEYVVSTIDSDGLEKIFHAELEAYRINPRREFFKIDLEHAIAILKELTDYD